MTDEKFIQTFDAYKDDVFRLAYSYLQNKEDAEDTMEEVFAVYFYQPPNQENRVKAWLMSVTVKKSLNRLKTRPREAPQVNPSWDEIAVKEEPKNPRLEEVLTAINQLPKRYQAPIKLFYYGELSVEEIANRLRISNSTAKKRLERGRNAIRKILEENNDE